MAWWRESRREQIRDRLKTSRQAVPTGAAVGLHQLGIVSKAAGRPFFGAVDTDHPKAAKALQLRRQRQVVVTLNITQQVNEVEPEVGRR